MRAATRKKSEQHKDEMAIRTMKRDLRRRRQIGLRIAQAQAREMSRRLIADLQAEAESASIANS